MSEDTVAFGDTVRIREAPATERARVAGLTGTVYGFTTPSVTRVQVIGELSSDYALNVFFDELNTSLWIAPELLELVDHNPGATITLDGVPKRWVRAPDGSWEESRRWVRSREWLAWLRRLMRLGGSQR